MPVYVKVRVADRVDMVLVQLGAGQLAGHDSRVGLHPQKPLRALNRIGAEDSVGLPIEHRPGRNRRANRLPARKEAEGTQPNRTLNPRAPRLDIQRFIRQQRPVQLGFHP